MDVTGGLKETKRILARKGRCRFRMVMPSGEMCLSCAIRVAFGATPGTYTITDKWNARACKEAERVVEDVIYAERLGAGIINFNDSMEVTDEDVQGVLDRAIKLHGSRRLDAQAEVGSA